MGFKSEQVRFRRGKPPNVAGYSQRESLSSPIGLHIDIKHEGENRKKEKTRETHAAVLRKEIK